MRCIGFVIFYRRQTSDKFAYFSFYCTHSIFGLGVCDGCLAGLSIPQVVRFVRTTPRSPRQEVLRVPPVTFGGFSLAFQSHCGGGGGSGPESSSPPGQAGAARRTPVARYGTIEMRSGRRAATRTAREYARGSLSKACRGDPTVLRGGGCPYG